MSPPLLQRTTPELLHGESNRLFHPTVRHASLCHRRVPFGHALRDPFKFLQNEIQLRFDTPKRSAAFVGCSASAITCSRLWLHNSRNRGSMVSWRSRLLSESVQTLRMGCYPEPHPNPAPVACFVANR